MLRTTLQVAAALAAFWVKAGTAAEDMKLPPPKVR